MFYPLQVEEVSKTTSDCTVVEFRVTENLREKFKFIQGQYLTLKTEINGEEVRRSYSLCSSPLDGEWKVAIKKIEDGKFSTFANDVLRAGDTLDVMPPNGRFYKEVEPNSKKNYIAFAAGSGITPILSIIKTHLTAEPDCSFKLFYVNRTATSVILKEEVEALKNQYLNRFEIFYFLTREERHAPLFNGRIDEKKLEKIFKLLVDVNEVDDCFVCGPEEMIFCVRDFLLEKGMDKKHIKFELFNTGTGKKNQKAVTSSNTGEQGVCEVTLQEGGKTFNFNLPKGGNNILDAALNASADLPFACKGGVCCTCRAKLVEGQVEMKVNYALEEDEVEAGYILTCQAIPLTDKVVVDFDA